MSCVDFVATDFVRAHKIQRKQNGIFQFDLVADLDHKSGKKIDLIIGADFYGSVIRDGLIQGPDGGPTAQFTIFGWVISGPVSGSSSRVNSFRIAANLVSIDDDLDRSLRQFWELEQVPCRPARTEEESRCDEHFRRTHSRMRDGRYVVRLPFKSDLPVPIGDTECDAKCLFLTTEARFNRLPAIAQAYRVHEGICYPRAHGKRACEGDISSAGSLHTSPRDI